MTKIKTAVLMNNRTGKKVRCTTVQASGRKDIEVVLLPAKRDSTQVLWQVQNRRSRAHGWVNRGRFETRSSARERAVMLRDVWGMYVPPDAF